MNTFKLIGMALFTMLVAINLIACSNHEEVFSEKSQEEKYVTVGLGCSGEFLEITNSPLSRGTVQELYGVQVYSVTESENTTGNGSGSSDIKYEYIPYAYGLFASLEEVTIKLLKDHKYKFIVSVVLDPFNRDDTDLDDYWFGIFYSKYVKEKGLEFTYSTTSTINLLGMTVGGVYDQYCYDRYYGEIDQYDPQENNNIDIPTKRVVYGANYIAQDLTEGTLDILVGNIYSVKLTPQSYEYENIYTFTDIYAAWKGAEIWNADKQKYEIENYRRDCDLVITWIKDDGTTTPLGTYTVTFERNVMHTIKVKLKDATESQRITVTRSESFWSNEKEYEISN